MRLDTWLTERNAVWIGAGILGDTEITEYSIGNRHVIVARYNSGPSEAWEIYVQSSTSTSIDDALRAADQALSDVALEERIRELEEAGRRASESSQESEDAMRRTIARQNRELETAARRERDERDQGYWREDKLKSLERAKELGDLITQDRILAELKRGW